MKKIVFFYVESSENGFIRKQGFNFTSRHHFEVDVSFDKYVLRDEKVDIHDIVPENFFDPISEITAIVGPNGAGKTTLLKELCYLVGIDRTNRRNNDKYNKYYREEYNQHKRLVIIEEREGLVCYHNLNNLKISSGLRNIKEIDYFRNKNYKKTDIHDHYGPYGLSTIVFTNSYWENDGEDVNSIGNGIMESGGKVSNAYLTPDTLAAFSRDFYKRKIRSRDAIAGGYYQFLDMCVQKKSTTAKDFQRILDIYYLRDSSDNEITSWYNPTIKISVFPIEYFINEILENKQYIYNLKSKDGKEPSFEETVICTYEVYKDLTYKIAEVEVKTNLILRLYLNLLFDVLLYERVYDSKVSKEMGFSTFHNVNEVSAFLHGKLCSKRGRYQVFRGYADEIERLSKIIRKCSINDRLLPHEDLSYRNEIILERETTCYKDFIDFVCFLSETNQESFLLRYIKISGLTFSSGERTLLNLFTWINMLGHQEELFGEKSKKFQKDVLLLVDEIDLALHPEWQRRIVLEVKNMVGKLFIDKNVQIIYTTHSPISLSDMPRGNVVFLNSSDNEKCSVDKRYDHSKTFGSNIYTLYNDAFFLKDVGQIGEFAKLKIKELIEELKPEIKNGEDVYSTMSEEEIAAFRSRIDMIGEPIIRGQLYKMLIRHSNQSNDKDFISKHIQELEKRVAYYKELRGDYDSN